MHSFWADIYSCNDRGREKEKLFDDENSAKRGRRRRKFFFFQQ